MRLSDYEIESIKRLAATYFGEGSKVYIFGSRVDDSRHGGDIDIYIESDDVGEMFKRKLFFILDLQELIGEQKIDVVVNDLANQQNLPIYDIAKREGVAI